MKMITVKQNCITIQGEREEVIEEMKEMKEVYGNKSVSEIIELIQAKWRLNGHNKRSC